MKVSMKKIIRAMSIIMVVIVYITTIILSGSIALTGQSPSESFHFTHLVDIARIL